MQFERYWKRVQECFCKFLKCRTDILLLIKEQPSKEKIRKKTLSADIIYVGGGNTLQMMRVWRRLGVDKLIKSAYENGTVLSGISSGSICWFDSDIPSRCLAITTANQLRAASHG
jgi:dipeptidase E